MNTVRSSSLNCVFLKAHSVSVVTSVSTHVLTGSSQEPSFLSLSNRPSGLLNFPDLFIVFAQVLFLHLFGAAAHRESGGEVGHTLLIHIVSFLSGKKDMVQRSHLSDTDIFSS